MKLRLVLLLPLMFLPAAVGYGQNKRDQAVRQDRRQLAENESWFYDDLKTAFDEAKRTKRPLMIVFR